MAAFLDTFFYPFDYAILEAIHAFALATGGALTFLVRLITSVGDGGLGFILFGIALLFFRKTRKTGLIVLGAILVGALITNLSVKPLVARPRPYTHEPFVDWWRYVGGTKESEFSFPSGHTTTAFAAMGAVFLHCNKKYSWTALVFAALIGFTRMYLMVHYPTDVLGGVLVGMLAALVAWALLRLAFRALDAHADHPVCHVILEADIVLLVRRLFGKKESTATGTDTDNRS